MLEFMKPEKKTNIKCNIITQAYWLRAACENHQVQPESLKTFQPS